MKTEKTNIQYLQNICTKDRIELFHEKISTLDPSSQKLIIDKKDAFCLPSIIEPNENIIMVAEERQDSKNNLLIILTSERILYIEIPKLFTSKTSLENIQYDKLPLSFIRYISLSKDCIEITFDNNEKHYLYIEDKMNSFIELVRSQLVLQAISRMDKTVQKRKSQIVLETSQILAEGKRFGTIQAGRYMSAPVLVVLIDNKMTILSNLNIKTEVLRKISLSNIDLMSIKISQDKNEIRVLSENIESIVEFIDSDDCKKIATTISSFGNPNQLASLHQIAISEIDKTIIKPDIQSSVKPINNYENKCTGNYAAKTKPSTKNIPIEDNQSNQAGSIAEEISKLSDFRDKGILTEEEFAAAKKKLLGIK